jgi:hypothetical protein
MVQATRNSESDTPDAGPKPVSILVFAESLNEQMERHPALQAQRRVPVGIIKPITLLLVVWKCGMTPIFRRLMYGEHKHSIL